MESQDPSEMVNSENERKRNIINKINSKTNEFENLNIYKIRKRTKTKINFTKYPKI